MVKSNTANNMITGLINELVTIIQFLTLDKILASAWINFKQQIKQVPVNYNKLLQQTQRIKMAYLDTSSISKQSRPSIPSINKFTSPFIKNEYSLLQENQKTIKTKFEVGENLRNTFISEKLKSFLQKITNKKIVLDDSIKNACIFKSQYNIKSLIEILSLGLLKQLYKNKKYQLLEEICSKFQDQAERKLNYNGDVIFSKIRQKLFQFILQRKRNVQISDSFLKFGYSLEFISNLAMIVFTYLIDKFVPQINFEIKLQQQLEIIKIFNFYIPIKILRFKQNNLYRQEYLQNNHAISPLHILSVQINDIKDYYLLGECPKIKGMQIKSDKREQKCISYKKNWLQQKKKNRTASLKKANLSQKRYDSSPSPYNLLLQQKQNKIILNSKISKKTKQLLSHLNKSLEQINKLIKIKSQKSQNISSFRAIRTVQQTPQQQSAPFIQINLKNLSD